MQQKDFRKLGCAECASGSDLGFDFTMAFQPIVDVQTKRIFAQEALVRGRRGESAFHVFQQVNETNRYRFDQSCRVKAIKLAAELNIAQDSFLSINFLPNAVYKPELCIRTTLNAAETFQFPKEKIIFEFTENEQITDSQHLESIITHYQQQGFLTATDDFGSGFNGLNQLADLKTDMAKIDMVLIRHIDQDQKRRIIVRNLVRLFSDLDMTLIAEGVETQNEFHVLRDMGVRLFQGYYFAKPCFESLAPVHWG
ncbi:EAL domain-containing protein [Marinomonas sp. IMCC 4694]|uniref:EAL domain-containing protein n=1 Tax=Marinomonas sp. IMCC 4694 TaxID=2605432 RepID=UPI0011E803D6|nr:EAL domain-containing protein [Marinomonas sp. IMCC 4694]TYL46769.1 EAL domain-containing protein [Marinomonas sp. IMCC 4694]